MLIFAPTKITYGMDINNFKSSNIFKLYDSWVGSLIAGDYYSPDTFDDEGNLVTEDDFMEDEFKEAKDRILEVSHYIYREMADCHVFQNYPAGSLAYGETDSASVVICLLNKHNDYNLVVLLGTIYFMLVYDYPTYSTILGNSRIKMRAYNKLFTHVFVKINSIQDWLDLYASLRGTICVLELPPSLQTPKALEYLRKLQDARFLDINFGLSSHVMGRGWARLIAHNLNIYANCVYRDLEAHFKISNLRDNRTLDEITNRINNPQTTPKIQKEKKIYNAIEACFSKI